MNHNSYVVHFTVPHYKTGRPVNNTRICRASSATHAIADTMPIMHKWGATLKRVGIVTWLKGGDGRIKWLTGGAR